VLGTVSDMAKAKMQSPTAPRPFGYERMVALTLDEVVDALGVEHRSRAALWRLVAAGADAIPTVTRGLTSSNPGVRRGCCEFLDLYWDADAAKAMLPLLEDPDPDVRWMAAHALSCERCKGDHWAKRQRSVHVPVSSP
jgi:hypothetical protein